MKNPDQEPDVESDRKRTVRELFRKFGDNSALLLTLSELTGKTLPEVSDAWTKSKQTVQQAIGRSA